MLVPANVRERILVYGPPESGKTTGFLDIAKLYAETGTPGHFYVISTDLAYEALRTDPEYSGLDNITVFDADVNDMQQFIDAGKEIKAKGKLADWFSVDLLLEAWRAATDEYANVSTKGKIDSVGNLWKTSGSVSDFPIQGWEWGMPNARYRYLLNNCVKPFRGHVYCVTGQKELLTTSGSGKTREDELVKLSFSHIGLKPDVKADEEAHRFHSILHFTGSRARGFRICTGKDRFKYRRLMGQQQANKMWRGEEYDNFPNHYLIGVAKWKLT